MRWLALPAATLALFVVTTTVVAQNPVESLDPAKTRYVVCYIYDGNTRYVTQVQEIHWRDTRQTFANKKQFISVHAGEYIVTLEPLLAKEVFHAARANCDLQSSPDYDDEMKPGYSYQTSDGRTITLRLRRIDPSAFYIERFAKNLKVTGFEPRSGKPSEQPALADKTTSDDSHAPEGREDADQRTRDEAARKATAEAEAQIAAERARTSALNDEQKRKAEADLAKIAADKRKAAEAERVYQEGLAKQKAAEAELAAYDRQLAKNRTLQRYCETMGNCPAEDAAKDAGDASTEYDANRCITQAQVSPSKTWKGALQADVVNGCQTAVDIRICLMTSRGWNCKVQWGVLPQQKFTAFSFDASGAAYASARVTGGKGRLDSPPD
jgi:hypothetical protein